MPLFALIPSTGLKKRQIRIIWSGVGSDVYSTLVSTSLCTPLSTFRDFSTISSYTLVSNTRAGARIATEGYLERGKLDQPDPGILCLVVLSRQRLWVIYDHVQSRWGHKPAKYLLVSAWHPKREEKKSVRTFSSTHYYCTVGIPPAAHGTGRV